MSRTLTIQIQRVDLIGVDARAAGSSFANADAKVQTEFLSGLAEAVAAYPPNGTGWKGQAEFIARELGDDRARLRKILATLFGAIDGKVVRKRGRK